MLGFSNELLNRAAQSTEVNSHTLHNTVIVKCRSSSRSRPFISSAFNRVLVIWIACCVVAKPQEVYCGLCSNCVIQRHHVLFHVKYQWCNEFKLDCAMYQWNMAWWSFHMSSRAIDNCLLMIHQMLTFQRCLCGGNVFSFTFKLYHGDNGQGDII